MKTAISIPDHLFESAERLARRLGISRSELYQRAIRAYLLSQQDAGVTEALDRLYGRRGAGAAGDPGLQDPQLGSLLPDKW